MNKYFKFILRLIESFLIFIIAISLVFVLLYLAQSRNDNSSTGAIISGNFFIDWLLFIKNTLSFNFGTSISDGALINPMLLTRMGISFAIAGLTVIVSLIGSIPLAIWFARKPRKIVDTIGMFWVSIFIAIPGFIFGYIFMIIASKIGTPFSFANFSTWIMPILSLILAPMAYKIVMLRSSLINNRNQEFVKFAMVRGSSNRRIKYRHLLRISLFPIISYLPTSFLISLLGTIIIENIFGIPGAGSWLADAIKNKDYSIIQTIFTISILIIISSYYLNNVICKLIDPRVRVK